MEIKNLPSLKQFKEIAKAYRRLNPSITSHSASLDLLTKEMKFAKNWNTLRPQLLSDREIDTAELEKIYADAELDLKDATIKTYLLQKNEILGFVIMAFAGHNEWGEHYVAEYCFEAEKHRKPLYKHVQEYGGMASIYENALNNNNNKEEQAFKVLMLWKDNIIIEGFTSKVKKLYSAEAKQKALDEISIGEIREFSLRQDENGNYCEDVRYYEVVKKTGSYVHFKEIGAEIIPEENVPEDKRSLKCVHRMREDGGDVYKRPLPGKFIDDNVFRRKIKYFGESLSEVGHKMSFSYITHEINGYESNLIKIDKDDIWYRDKLTDQARRAGLNI